MADTRGIREVDVGSCRALASVARAAAATARGAGAPSTLCDALADLGTAVSRYADVMASAQARLTRLHAHADASGLTVRGAHVVPAEDGPYTARAPDSKAVADADERLRRLLTDVGRARGALRAASHSLARRAGAPA